MDGLDLIEKLAKSTSFESQSVLDAVDSQTSKIYQDSEQHMLREILSSTHSPMADMSRGAKLASSYFSDMSRAPAA